MDKKNVKAKKNTEVQQDVVSVVVDGASRVRMIRGVDHFIRDWRQHRGMTMDQLAEAAVDGDGNKLSVSMVSQLERGRAQYTQPTLERIAKALGCQPWQLLACGPEENQRLWEHVLGVCAPDIVLGEMSAEAVERLRVLVLENANAAVRSARAIDIGLVERKKADGHDHL